MDSDVDSVFGDYQDESDAYSPEVVRMSPVALPGPKCTASADF